MPPPDRAAELENVGLFKDLPTGIRDQLAAQMEQRLLHRGDVLLRQGAAAEAIYVTLSGRFEVRAAGRQSPLAEIGPGQPIGEIAFLAGGTRTATVTALRDSIVLRLGRAAFDNLCAANPALWPALTTTLARRVAAMNERRAPPPDPRPRTIAVIAAGAMPVPQGFLAKLAAVMTADARVTFVSSAEYPGGERLGARFLAAENVNALNDLEFGNDFLVYVADEELTDWSRKTIRQADLILRVGDNLALQAMPRDGSGRYRPNEMEAYAQELHEAQAHRLALLHNSGPPVTGTAMWLAERDVAMHHHLTLDDDESFQRLFRFIKGTARGLVACGGGAFCAAHPGVYKAIAEAGISFDMMGGTSGGAAMAAAFALGTAPDEIDRQMHEMFVLRKALRQLTLPVYSLIDHTVFDKELRGCFGSIDIEDLWIPYFAVSTNLSCYGLHCHRRGQLWQAVRASGSIPALLPPFYTKEGEMLVDGALVDNVPVRVMRSLKSGPNVVLNFAVPKEERFAIQYDDLPSRGKILSRFANPMLRGSLPDAPSAGTVLMRSMMANRHEFTKHLTEEDLLLQPPLPSDMVLLDWHRHSEVMEGAYRWAIREIEALVAAEDQAWQALST